VEKHKWYELGLPNSLTDLAAAVKKRRFETGALSGFVAGESTSDEYKFRFFWTSYLSRLSVAADGGETIERVSTLSFCDIALFKAGERTWLRVTGSGRTNRELLNVLEQLVGYGFWATAVTFLGRNRTPNLPRGAERRIMSFKAVCSLPEQAAVARVEAASKEGLDLANFPLLQQGKYSLEQVTFEVTYRRIKGQLSIANTGVLRISGQLAPLLLEAVEATFTVPA
jgi:hypothetical protein